jgi:putative cardiolipin synthase
VFDRAKIFIGSMNFDQRSMHLNTEIGLLVDSPELAQQVATRFDAMAQPVNAYRLALAPDNVGNGSHLVWRTQEGADEFEYDSEPARSDWQRAALHLLSLLPWENEL